MKFKNLPQLLAMMALMVLPFVVTGCDDEGPWCDGNNYWPDEYPNNGCNDADQMVAVLIGRWKGDMVYTYTADNAQPGSPNRVSEKYKVEMTFYRRETANEDYAGQGVEVDKNEQGDTQALNFVWWIDTKNGDIYVKYTDSNTIFRMDANSSEHGYHLGWESERNAYTFFGYLVGQSNDDEIYIDLERADSQWKAKPFATTTWSNVLNFGTLSDRIELSLPVTTSLGFHRR